jgi:H+/Cl- antiporter ClcA
MMFKYLGERLHEPSTYAALGAGCTSAAALPAPWGYIFMGVAFVGALMADPGNGKAVPADAPTNVSE